MNSRRQAILAALAALLLVVALITAVLWTLALNRRQSPPAARPAPIASEVRLYAGLPDASRYGLPVVVLTNAAYLTGYCEARRNPAWVAFSVGSITIGSTAKRPSRFIADTRTKSATHDDYTGSGFDRGHMAPNYAIATRYGQEAQRETFLMSNICPQAPDLNRIWWRLLEEKEANDFAVRMERVWVITGPIFDAAPKRLRGGVEVPAAFYRILLDEENGQPRALAFIAPQTATGRETLDAFLASVRDVEAQTGLDFHPALPKEAQDRLEAPRAARLW